MATLAQMTGPQAYDGQSIPSLSCWIVIEVDIIQQPNGDVVSFWGHGKPI